MNEFFQSHLVTIILFLLFIILFLIGIIGFVLVKLLLQNNKQTPAPSQPTPHVTVEQRPVLKKVTEEHIVEKFYCSNHPDAQSVGGCLICEDVFCENCLIEHDGLYFCKEHFRIFANNKWKQITDVKTTPDTPIDGLYVYHFKRKIWKENNVPSFILTHYKINIENDFIESFVQLNVIESEADRLEAEIKKYQAQL